jgi:hypothetical protein
MTPQRTHIKVLKTYYGKPDGYDYSNAGVAFGETEKKENGRRNKRIVKPDVI